MSEKIEKILLIKPPERSFFNFGTFSLGVLTAAVRDLAKVIIIDATEMSLAEAAQKVREQAPALVGVTAMGMQSVLPVADFTRYLKSEGLRTGKMAAIPVVVGGHGASMVPKPLLEAGADCVVMGEGEKTFREIVNQGLKPGIKGTAWLKNGDLQFGPARPLIATLDHLQPPSRDLMPSPPNGVHLMETSRGCPHNCFFCETTRFNGRRWRPHSPERVVQEIRRLVDEHDAWIIHFADDNFAASTERVKKICRLLRNENLPAFFMASARADDLVADPELLPLMAETRMLRITVGIETLDPDLAAKSGKPIAPEIYRQAFDTMRSLGIFSIASLIVGLPGETPLARQQTMDLTVDVGPDSAHFLPFQPQPGIPMAAGLDGHDAEPADIRDAAECNRIFFHHPTVQARLKKAAEQDDIHGLLARSSLENPLHSGLKR